MKNSLGKIIFFIILIHVCENIRGQELNENYMLFSESNDRTEYLEFKSDSIVERKPYLYHNPLSIANLVDSNIFREYRYEKLKNTIRIYGYENSSDIDFRFSNNYFFENTDLGIVYVLRNQFDEFPDIAVKFENEIYWMDSPETSNGIIKKDGKKNRRLSRLMRKKDTSDLHFEIYKGYKAFEKFGYKYVFGIIEVIE